MHDYTYRPSLDGTSPHEQLDLFSRTPPSLASTSVVGLTISTEPCLGCGSTVAVVGSSCAMHSARLSCCACGRHSRWLSREDFQLLTETVEAIGHPTSPIRRSFVTGLSTHAPY
jgi:hypothetical protein